MKYTELYDKIRKTEAQLMLREIEDLKFNSTHAQAIRDNEEYILYRAKQEEKIQASKDRLAREEAELEDVSLEELEKSLDRLDAYIKEEEEAQHLEERYSYQYDGTDSVMYLHKSKRYFSTSTALKPSDAYSVKAETGLTWKQLDWIFNKNNN